MKRTVLKRTGKMMPFLEVSIGNPFFAHGRIWVRTDYNAATEFKSSGNRMVSTCNFLIDECDREVEVIEVVEETDENV